MPLTEINGAQLDVRERGSGEAVIFVHGAMGDECAAIVKEPVLINNFRVIDHNRRGWGNSSIPAMPVTMQQQIADCGDEAAVLRFLDMDGSLVHVRRPAGVCTHRSWIGRTLLHEAAVRGETVIGRLLIDRGADVNATAGDNITPLHLAACGGHREMVDLLLAASADRHVRDRSHDATPGDWARWWGHPDLGDYLERLQA